VKVGRVEHQQQLPAMLDFPELEVPFSKMICPRRP
jgi:hypothetical protein